MRSGYKCNVKGHGDFQIEIKTRYPVSNKKSRYEIELYIFSPSVLAVDEKGYGTKNFLNDLKIMTRLSTPEISLPGLLRKDFEESPLTRIKKEFKKLDTGNGINEKRVLYELRSLASIIRVQMRKSRFFLKRKLETGEEPELLSNWLINLTNQLGDFLSVFRRMKRLFINPEISEKLNSAYDWADESISLNIQRELSIMYGICNTFSFKPECFSDFASIVDYEIKYRKKRNFDKGPLRKELDPADTIIYRENILKKWSQSILYLSEDRSSKPAGIGQIIAGTAAAAAMSFAVVATILTDKFFPGNTTAWALAAVLAYIVKDRIKEILRSGLKILFPGSVPDRMTVLRDSSQQKRIGHSKSYVKFNVSDQIDMKVRIARGWEDKTFKELLPPENVIAFYHKIFLNGNILYRYHKRFSAVNEIIRLELSRFIQLMDDPVQIYYSFENGKIRKKRQRRTYHLNLITILKDPAGNEEKVTHYRVVLNRDGIISIEERSVDK